MALDRRQLLNDPETSLKIALNGRQASIWTALPCIVNSVNFSQMTIEAQPTIQGQIENEDGTFTYVNLPLLLDVPIVFPSAGGFTITLPIQVGDEVLVIFSSRCIDSWWQSGGIQKPMEARMHDLSDAFCIPGPKSIPNVISGISSTAAQIRNNAGTTYVEISADGKIKLVTPSTVEITGNLTVSGNISTTSGDVTAGLISLKNHTHAVTTAPGTTGPALP